MPEIAEKYQALQTKLHACSVLSGKNVQLLAVSKTQPMQAIQALAALGQNAFGENYVQEAVAKISALNNSTLRWHLIGPLQSNKCQLVAMHFDWVQTIDREKLIDLLQKYRPKHLPALNVLIQINIDDEASKHGCKPEQMHALAEKIQGCSHLKLRGIMAIPNPSTAKSGIAFERMQRLFLQLSEIYPHVDTLSMGMSDDFPLAIAHGATMIRVGSALFGQRTPTKEAL